MMMTVCFVSLFFLKDICFKEKQLELEPTAVSRACLTCMQEPIGKSPLACVFPKA